MAVRLCGWCGDSIDHMGARAQYCSTQHKKNAASKRHRERNPGYYAKYHGSPARIAWKSENLDRIRSGAREQQRKYREQNPDAAAAWWAANPEKHRLYQSTRRARQAEGPGISERDWLRLVNRYDGRCAYCGVKPDKVHLDHVIPLKRGGRHSIGNALPACKPCNSSKNARLLYAWSITQRLTAYALRLQEQEAS